MITEDMIKTALIQLYHNKDGYQKYKLKVRLNVFRNDKVINIDFLAPLTKDRRNFKRYFPEGNETWFLDWSDEVVSDIKSKHNVKPYRGKFHLIQNFNSEGDGQIQIEPWCQCVVFFDDVDLRWKAMVSIYGFQQAVVLSNEYITQKQAQTNQVANYTWTNPKHRTQNRPKTLAQLWGK